MILAHRYNSTRLTGQILLFVNIGQYDRKYQALLGQRNFGESQVGVVIDMLKITHYTLVAMDLSKTVTVLTPMVLLAVFMKGGYGVVQSLHLVLTKKCHYCGLNTVGQRDYCL